MGKLREVRTEEWQLKKLRPHPQQAELFGDLPESTFEELKEIIRTGKLKHLPEILPNGTIISGHCRVKAAMELGLKTMKVRVRHDLADADDGDVLLEMMSDNTVRRQMTTLQQVRCIERQRNLAAEEKNPERRAKRLEQVEVMFRGLGLSPRNVNRYRAVLKTPRSIQDAVDRGVVKLNDAARVKLLPPKEQERLDEELKGADAQSIRKAVARSLSKAKGQPEAHQQDAYDILITALRKIQKTCGKGFINLPRTLGDVDSVLKALKYGKRRINALIEQLDSIENQQQAPTESGSVDREAPPMLSTVPKRLRRLKPHRAKSAGGGP